jgi:hypothetical protein
MLSVKDNRPVTVHVRKPEVPSCHQTWILLNVNVTVCSLAGPKVKLMIGLEVLVCCVVTIHHQLFHHTSVTYALTII